MRTERFRHLAGFFSVGLAFCLLGAVQVAYVQVPMNPGDQLSVHLAANTTLSSASSGAGDTFGVVAAAPFLAQGNVAVIAGAIGQGHVVSVKPAKGNKPAALAIQVDWITAVDGQQVPLVATKKGDPLIFGTGGPYEKDFTAKSPVTVGPDFVFNAFVNAQRYIQINTAP